MESTDDIFQLEIQQKEQPIEHQTSYLLSLLSAIISYPNKQFIRFLLSFKPKYHGNLILSGFFTKTNPNYPSIVIGKGDYGHFIFALIIFITYTFLFYSFMWSRSNYYINIICLSGAIIHHITYIILFLSNPGLNLDQPNEEEDNENHVNIPICEHCLCIKYPNRNQRHCQDCNACYFSTDHHCPWISTCVAGNNVRLFNIFLLMTLMQFVLPVIVILYYKKQ